jgi:outer membrane protein assembly factor BamB
MIKTKISYLLIAASWIVSVGMAADWNQFRGPERDGRSSETGLLKQWPEAGLPELWHFGECGQSYASVAVVDDVVYTTGMIDNKGYLIAIDAKGKQKWKVEYGPEWTGDYPGTRCTPTIDGEHIYVMSGLGRLACFNLSSGKEAWKVGTLEKFEGKNVAWGISESVLIEGDKVICTPGGQDATIIAVNKKTGKTIWTSKGLSNVSAYCSPIAVQHGDRRLLLTLVHKLVVALDCETGKVLWTIPHEPDYGISAITPVYQDGYMYYTGQKTGGTAIKLSADGDGYTELWKNPALDTKHGGIILHKGNLYGSDIKKNWVCLGFKDGELKYREKLLGARGATIYADGMLYCYDEEGTVALVTAAGHNMKRIGAFKITRGEKEHWAHPAISNARLYIRHGESLMAYSIKGP